MQKTLWKILLTCLVLLAIPLQGIAGLSVSACAGHHQNVYSAADIARSARLAGGDVVASEAHSHDVGTAHAGHDARDVNNDDDGTKANASPQKCGGCGPCCIGAVMPSASQPSLAVLSGKTDFPLLSSRHVSPAVRGLDRPPQTVSA